MTGTDRLFISLYARETGELLRQICNLINAVPADEMWNTVRYLQSYR